MFPVIDLFAGPGGLNEGFSSVHDNSGVRAFQTVASFEMDATACQTLRLRAAMRDLGSAGRLHDDYYSFISDPEVSLADFSALPHVRAALERAENEVHEHKLGADRRATERVIAKALEPHHGHPWVLIGGPPCQAYSLAGRSRRTNDTTFEDDEKHVLYQEYLHIIRKFEPTVFVMENVKGLLSSKHRGERVFDLIRGDLTSPKRGLEYEVRSFVVDKAPEDLKPQDFVIRAEDYGVPQRRHRVILLGLRRGFDFAQFETLAPAPKVSVRHAISDLPQIRSRISPLRADTLTSWEALRDYALEKAGIRQSRKTPDGWGGPTVKPTSRRPPNGAFEQWIRDPLLPRVIHHEARSHMKEDLVRYGLLAGFATRQGRSLKLTDPEFQGHLPQHSNIGREDTPFTDRFRVQLWDMPSTTVVSHISKDGHYYIHPDAEQMRSLTVREAARLQSFPDNYFFCGGRTQQYHQVGNAVPPLLASQLATVVARLLGRDVV